MLINSTQLPLDGDITHNLLSKEGSLGKPHTGSSEAKSNKWEEGGEVEGRDFEFQSPLSVAM